MSVIFEEYASDPRPHIERFGRNVSYSAAWDNISSNTFFMTADELMNHLRKRKAIR